MSGDGKARGAKRREAAVKRAVLRAVELREANANGGNGANPAFEGRIVPSYPLTMFPASPSARGIAMSRRLPAPRESVMPLAPPSMRGKIQVRERGGAAPPSRRSLVPQPPGTSTGGSAIDWGDEEVPAASSRVLRDLINEQLRVRPSDQLQLRAAGNYLRPASRMPVGAIARATEYFSLIPEEITAKPPPLLRPLPRRKPIAAEAGRTGTAPIAGSERFVASFWRTLGRVVVWGLAACHFFVAIAIDRLLRRDSVERRAQRLRALFEWAGGTLLKLGQQLALRADTLPYAYCDELSKLLDAVPPIPTEDAIAVIERACGKKLAEMFAVFDPTPIGSASIASVFQAVLVTGEKVAVKVRRPHIGRIFAADLQALRWILDTVEWLTLVRPGTTRHLIAEFDKTCTDELDFRREVRFQEIFRRNANKKQITPNRFFTAPRLHFALCSSEVIVQDFSTGVSLAEVLAAVEDPDPEGKARARLRELGIDPKVVARRFMWVGNWGMLSNFFFHADPHPANVIVKENNELVLVDFGACGMVNSLKRRAWLELNERQAREDVHGMVQACINLLEPLPPIDMNAFEKELEAIFVHSLTAIWSKHSQWYERTSAAIWIPFFGLCRRYQIPVNLDTLQMFRVNMLADTIALRLDPKIDLYENYREFARDAAKVARRKIRRQLGGQIRKRKVQDHAYIRLERFLETTARAGWKFQRFLDKPSFNFNFMVEKSVFSFMTLVYALFATFVIISAGCAAVALQHLARGEAITVVDATSEALRHPLVVLSIAFSLLLALRRMLFRLRDRHVASP